MNAENETAMTLLEQKLLDIFAALQRGDDVAPARCYRTEGFAEALVALGVCSESAVAELIARCWKAVFGVEPPEHLAPLSIPATMQRAPVYPSTSD